ncbi:ribonucleoside-diphosphate reductase subunit alpha [Thermogemmatispora sp.]|uniref:ribonucleoside-diphosphate reductase subunit alpha n=1 Tax=Thermogemmatispora sp. TaxID=1968838 RepID=UPI001D679563|nr:ribonucleoside-diphosphate reductase subunit alpha [Thermogemmatispora sp.]MBX5449259.1 ribonucleoside-diphosphate reductase subunit alpha [Thermogemmatispora sp.]
MAFSANQTRPETPVTIDPEHVLAEVCRGFEDRADRAQLLAEVEATLGASLSEAELWQALLLVARAHIEQEPAFSYITARILLLSLYREALRSADQLPCSFADMEQAYRHYLPHYIQRGIETGLLDSRLASFDLQRLAALIRPERDLLFTYPGLQTLYDRYLLQYEGQRFELPQLLWLRVAMGLALNEEQKEQRVAEFYEVLSQFYFTPATPTLFNAGTSHPQLSSCYLTTVNDDLWHIFKCIQDNALLSKWAGGLGNDWTRVRALGAYIRGTNGRSQGVIPFLKVVNDTAVAVNQGGKRKGAVCAYLENWHLDIEDFLDLRRNTGDERRRTHDLHTACWISDEFMRRVESGEQWTLFSPDEVPDLHELYGRAFAERYREYERLADEGKIRLWKRMPAVELWRKMLTRLFETGHPWLTWKDPANVRSPQDHAGVIHSSNLCTEILLNTSAEETAVCNLGSLNLVAHLVNGQLDHAKLRSTIQTAMRMLDNVIDINYYPTPEARTANLRHRPVGLGVMGFQDALFQLGISYASQEAVEFADRSMEAIAYYAILASSELAAERGPYPSYRGSKWDRGLLPIDTIALLEQERGGSLEMDRSTTMDWEVVRAHIRQHGMRNSNVLAIAPTATISLIVGVSPSIEPIYKNLYVKSTLSGEFTTVNTFLVNDLKAAGLWNADMLEALKYYDGSLQELPMVPEELKQRYLTAFEIDPRWLIECASRRQKWIDMGQSLNLYLASPSGKQLHEIYMRAWKKGLKTTYYLRTLAATQVEKSTVDINRWGIQPRWMKSVSPSSAIQIKRGAFKEAPSSGLAAPPPSSPARQTEQNSGQPGTPASSAPLSLTQPGAACSLDDDCEACQ